VSWVTLSQLRSFLAVARLGAVKAAAEALDVTEPAVSGAVACLRRELGDPLFVRSGGGIVLTPGGRRLAASAADILGLAEEARQRIGEIAYEVPQLKVAANSTVAEYVVPPLLEAFGKRYTSLETSTLVVPGTAFAEVLGDRRADVAIGPRPAGNDGDTTIESVSVLKFQLVVVGATSHQHSYRGPGMAPRLAAQSWLLGPSGLDQSTTAGAFLRRLGVHAEDVRAFPSMAAAMDRVAAGDGLSIVYSHVITPAVQAGRLAVVEVPGTPLNGLLYASALAADRRSPTAAALLRWITTPLATHAMQTASSGVPMNKFRPPVYVTLWR
jgi:DNA-binding transcriptional LysR family regulator